MTESRKSGMRKCCVTRKGMSRASTRAAGGGGGEGGEGMGGGGAGGGGGRRREGEPKSVYAHKELKGCILVSGIVDHKNGWGLDNRPVANLSRTTYGVNGSNTAFRKRTKNHGLPRGVELVRKGPKKGWFRGIRCKRLGPHRVHVFLSKRVWPTPEPAARWYQNQLKRLYNGRKSWAHNPTTVNFPIFPPRLEAELSTRSHRLREISRSEVHHDVPF